MINWLNASARLAVTDSVWSDRWVIILVIRERIVRRRLNARAATHLAMFNSRRFVAEASPRSPSLIRLATRDLLMKAGIQRTSDLIAAARIRPLRPTARWALATARRIVLTYR
jgi:hypothetical protein